MRRAGLAALVAVLAGAAAGCEGAPDLLCDRVRVIWPYFEIVPEADVSDEPGVQIDIAMSTGFLPGTKMVLFVEDESGNRVQAAQSVADDEGDALFSDVTVPPGDVVFLIEAENECGTYETGRSTFVWDGLGFPGCDLEVAEEAVWVAGLAHPVLGADADPDPETPGFQATVSVNAGRPDMEIDLFVLDRNTGEETALSAESGDELGATFPLTFTRGRWALRAVCTWPARERRFSSTTRTYLVDAERPTCDLDEPSQAVSTADDLDGDPENGVQFELIGRSSSEDVDPASARFWVGDEEVAGSPIEAGESRAEGSFSGAEPPAAQAFAFEVRDLAGNVCRAERTFP